MDESRISEIEFLTGDRKLSELMKLFESGYLQFEIDIALEIALAYSQLETADYLLSLGADLSHYDYEGVYYAVHNNELKALQYAISHGVDININNGMLLKTAVIMTINTKELQLIKWMFENNANPVYLTQDLIEIATTHGSDEFRELIRKYL